MLNDVVHAMAAVAVTRIKAKGNRTEKVAQVDGDIVDVDPNMNTRGGQTENRGGWAMVWAGGHENQ